MTQFFTYRESKTSSPSGQFDKMLNYLAYKPSNETTARDSLMRRQHVMEALDDSIRDEQRTLTPPNWVPPQHSLLFETTTRKLQKHRTSLEKQVLLKQLYSKLQTTKRHGIIILSAPPMQQKCIQTPPTLPLQLAYLRNAGHQKYYQNRLLKPIQRKRSSPPSPISPAPKSICSVDDDDNIPLGALLPTQQTQKQFHRIGVCVI